jgi:hypothetical protein
MKGCGFQGGASRVSLLVPLENVLSAFENSKLPPPPALEPWALIRTQRGSIVRPHDLDELFGVCEVGVRVSSVEVGRGHRILEAGGGRSELL